MAEWVAVAAAAAGLCSVARVAVGHLRQRFRRRRRGRGKPLRQVVAACEARWFLHDMQLAMAGDSEAMVRVGHMLTAGYGTRQDPQAAAQWLREAWAITSFKDPAHWDILDPEESAVPRMNEGRSTATAAAAAAAAAEPQAGAQPSQQQQQQQQQQQLLPCLQQSMGGGTGDVGTSSSSTTSSSSSPGRGAVPAATKRPGSNPTADVAACLGHTIGSSAGAGADSRPDSFHQDLTQHPAAGMVWHGAAHPSCVVDGGCPEALAGWGAASTPDPDPATAVAAVPAAEAVPCIGPAAAPFPVPSSTSATAAANSTAVVSLTPTTAPAAPASAAMPPEAAAAAAGTVAGVPLHTRQDISAACGPGCDVAHCTPCARGTHHREGRCCDNRAQAAQAMAARCSTACSTVDGGSQQRSSSYQGACQHQTSGRSQALPSAGLLLQLVCPRLDLHIGRCAVLDVLQQQCQGKTQSEERWQPTVSLLQ